LLYEILYCDPTYNGGDVWRLTVSNIKEYAPQAKVYVIDSSSVDDTKRLAEDAGFKVLNISGAEFNHGGTRNRLAGETVEEYDVVVFLTQDAIPQPKFLEGIISAFEDDDVACVYGRQLPHDDANPIAQHARYFNYPPNGYVCGKEDIKNMGIKTVFMSNSFSAYRLSIFKELGGSRQILSFVRICISHQGYIIGL
jgi:rhamnosyltransferase